jgi:hypothetical protein
MPRYTDTQEFSFNTNRDSRVVNVDGSVTIEVWDGTQYLADGNSPLTTGPYELFTKGIRIRFTPGGGAAYWIEDGEQA